VGGEWASPPGDGAGRRAAAVRPGLAPPPGLAARRGTDGVEPMNRRLNTAGLPAPRPAPADDELPSDVSPSTATMVARAADEYLERLAAREAPPRAEIARPSS